MPPTNNSSTSLGGQIAGSTATAQRVIPLLQAMARVEDLASALALRLDPIVQHAPKEQDDRPISNTVTSRVNTVGDVLQYLLDNIEL